MRLEVGSLSDRGQRREKNEDRPGKFETEFGEVFLIADGMGGHKGGALASKTVLEGMSSNLKAFPRNVSIETALQAAARATNLEVRKLSASGGPDVEGMGSTLVIAVVADEQLTVGHAGDSRAYLVRGGELRRLTRDHSAVQDLIQAGVLSEAEARVHPAANRITRAFGQEESLELDVTVPIPLDVGDKILLCSDGLFGVVEDQAIKEILARSETAKEACATLIERANAAGAPDNVTAIVIQCEDGQAFPSASDTWPELKIGELAMMPSTPKADVAARAKWRLLLWPIVSIGLLVGNVALAYLYWSEFQKVQKLQAQLTRVKEGNQQASTSTDERREGTQVTPKPSPNASEKPGTEPSADPATVNTKLVFGATSDSSGDIEPGIRKYLAAAPSLKTWGRKERAILVLTPASESEGKRLEKSLSAYRLASVPASADDRKQVETQTKGKSPSLVVYLPSPRIACSGILPPPDTATCVNDLKDTEAIKAGPPRVVLLRDGADVAKRAEQLKAKLSERFNSGQDFKVVKAKVDPDFVKYSVAQPSVDILVHIPADYEIK